MLRVKQSLLALSLLGVACERPTLKTQETKDEAPTPQSTKAPEPEPASQPKVAELSPQQVLFTTISWLGSLRSKDPKEMARFVTYPFTSKGLMPTQGESAASCKDKGAAQDEKAFEEIANCIAKNDLLLASIPENLRIPGVYELKITTLEEAFANEPELKFLKEHKKELASDIPRGYMRAYFPGEKENFYLIVATQWVQGNPRVVGVIAESEAVE